MGLELYNGKEKASNEDLLNYLQNFLLPAIQAGGGGGGGGGGITGFNLEVTQQLIKALLEQCSSDLASLNAINYGTENTQALNLAESVQVNLNTLNGYNQLIQIFNKLSSAPSTSTLQNTLNAKIDAMNLKLLDLEAQLTQLNLKDFSLQNTQVSILGRQRPAENISQSTLTSGQTVTSDLQTNGELYILHITAVTGGGVAVTGSNNTTFTPLNLLDSNNSVVNNIASVGFYRCQGIPPKFIKLTCNAGATVSYCIRRG